VIIVTEPGRPPLALVTTDLATPTAAIIERYASRWAIEVAFGDAKNITGAREARNRVRPAVERTVPFALYTQSIVVVPTPSTWPGHTPQPDRESRGGGLLLLFEHTFESDLEDRRAEMVRA